MADFAFRPGNVKVAKQGKFDLYKVGDKEHLLVHRDTNEIHHGFHGDTKDVKRIVKNYKVEDLPRPGRNSDG